MSNIDLIDNYLAGRMTDAERTAFEQQLAADPELKREYNFNKDVISSIQETRKAELKAMLNNIPVGGTASTFSTSAKVAGVLAAAAITVGAFYFIGKKDASEAEQKPLKEQPVQEIEETEQPNDISQQDTPESMEQKSEEAVEKQQETLTPAAEPKETTPAEIQTPNLVDGFENEHEATDVTEPEVYTDSQNFTAETLFDSNIEVITDESKKRYQFHYQMKDEKLYLYGSFDKGLYEILEFNNAQGKTIILYYKENYYHINPDQHAMTPLNAIKDQGLINKLNNLRN